MVSTLGSGNDISALHPGRSQFRLSVWLHVAMNINRAPPPKQLVDMNPHRILSSNLLE